MTKSEVKELINYLKTKLDGDVTNILRDFGHTVLHGKEYEFNDSTEDYELEITINWFPEDPKELEETKDEE
jgi:hypothetical protein